MVITIVKNIGIIDGLNAVIGADIFIPDNFINETDEIDIFEILQFLYWLNNT